ncbi:MAG: glycosyltransferase [Prevotella sp.]|nr:glycosyltransferase [Prevotella sp.]MBQ9237457.1 glycosyltransferase [Prevotella sp.]
MCNFAGCSNKRGLTVMRFCIITCTYNAENLIQRTLDSIASQTWEGIHHVVIDGASTDRTVETVERFYMDEKRVGHTLVSEPDKGLYDAMNKGLQRAKPDYVLFLNAGDTLHSPTTLEEIATKVNGNLPGVIYGDTNIVDATNRYVGKREHNPPEVLTWRSFKDGMLVCHQAFYVRTDIARKIPYDLRYRFSADVDWCIRVMKEAERQHLELFNMHSVVCNFLAGGLTIQNHRRSLHERFHIMMRHYGLLTTIWKHIGFAIGKREK